MKVPLHSFIGYGEGKYTETPKTEIAMSRGGKYQQMGRIL